MNSRWEVILVLAVTGLGHPGAATHVLADEPTADSASVQPREAVSTARIWDRRDHDVGEIRATVTNYGYLEGLTFPRRNGCSYMARAHVLFGGVRRADTLLAGTYGFRSSTPLVESSTDPSSRFYDPKAKAEQQFYAVYSDMPEPPYSIDSLMSLPDPPIGIEIHQTSFAWSDEGRKQSILVDYWIKNVSSRSIQHGAIGIAVDGSVICPEPTDFPAPDQDNICGLLRTVPALVPGSTDTINLAWMADNDGDLENPGFFRKGVPGVLGVRILRAPKGGRFSFNWWASLWRPKGLGWVEILRWGPFGCARSGVPDGNLDWYRTMVNGQIDYDQVYTALDMSSLGWNPPPNDLDTAVDLADGADTKLLLSYGPLEAILPGDSVPFTVAFSVGARFHRDPRNFADRFDPGNPRPYLDHLDYSDLIANARAIEWAFDSPGIDSDTTDGIGYRGEAHLFDCDSSDGTGAPAGCDSVFYRGDGIADFGLPAPPPPPEFMVITNPGKAIFRWNGARTEFARHPITGRRDFEGYRVYAGTGHSAGQFSLLASWDQENFARLEYDTLATGGWRQVSYPYSTAVWRRIMADSTFDPRNYAARSLDQAYRDVYLDTLRNYMGEVVEVISRERFSCWASEGPNHDNEYLAEGQPQTNLIQRVGERDTLVGGYGLRYGTYECTVANLQPSSQLYFAVTSFDQGDYVVKLPSLESAPAGNWKYAQPVYSADVVADSGLHVSVYPNPYKLVYNDALGHRTTYFAEGHEGQGNSEFTEYDRRIHFINLPDSATITIYSLDGDLIRVLEHPDKYLTTNSSSASWDLVSRNAQAVMSGIYIYRIDSKLGSQVGKIVIIK